MLGNAFRYEEMRCGYLTEQVKALRTFSSSQSFISPEELKAQSLNDLAVVLRRTFTALQSGERRTEVWCVCVSFRLVIGWTAN